MYELKALTELLMIRKYTFLRTNLLGMPDLRQLNLLAVINALCVSEFDPIKEFSDVFKGLSTMPGVFKIEKTKDVRPVKLFAPRPTAAGLKDKTILEIDKVLSTGVTEIKGNTHSSEVSGPSTTKSDTTYANTTKAKASEPILSKVSKFLDDVKGNELMSFQEYQARKTAIAKSRKEL
jgi:hypothetical protein